MKAFVLFAVALSVSGCATTGPSYQAAAGPGAVGYYAAPAADWRTTATGHQPIIKEHSRKPLPHSD